MHPEEWLDLVDENDQVIGKKLRAEVYAEGLLNYRVINVFVVNSAGKLWIPRRAAHKALFPLGLDVSAGGHVESGETYDESFAREVQEELNIDVSKTPYRVLGHMTPKDGVHGYERVYEIQQEEAPAYNPDDFIEYFWLTPAELIARIEGGEKAKGDLPKLVKRFYLNT